MPNRALNNLGLNTDWDLGEDGWKAGVDHNWLLLDTLAQARVLEIGRNDPPASPANGDIYAIGEAPTGDWLDHPGELALRDADAWTFVAPLAGWEVYNQADTRRYRYTATGWRPTKPLNNLTATTDPGAANDETEGYEPLSRWLNTNTGEFWLCIDATAGSAVWDQTTLSIDELGSLALGDDAADVPYSGAAPGSDVAAALDALQGQLGDAVIVREGTVTFPAVSDGWSRSDFQNLSFSPAFADGNYAVLFDYPSDAAAQSIGRIIAFDKAGNGCKVRATGGAGGTVRWVAVRLG